MFIDSYGVMELDFSQMAFEVSHHGYLLVTHLTTQEHCCHTPFHAYWYVNDSCINTRGMVYDSSVLVWNVMRSSRLFRVSLFLENGSILMIWGCFSIVSNVIRSNYCCRRHTMHGNIVFLRILFSLPHNKADVYFSAASKMDAGGHFVKNYKKNKVAYWSEMARNAIEWFSVIQNGRRRPFCEKFPKK